MNGTGKRLPLYLHPAQVQSAVIVGPLGLYHLQCIVHWYGVKHRVEVVVPVGAALSHLQPDIYLGMWKCNHSRQYIFCEVTVFCVKMQIKAAPVSVFNSEKTVE